MLTGHSFSGKANRFTLLLLEEDEFYILECVVECTVYSPRLINGAMGSAPGSLPGQLRVCTKSVFFEPDDIRIPIVRLPLKYIEELRGNISSIEVLTTSYATMKPGGRDEPYGFCREKSAWSFQLKYAALEDIIPCMQQMLAVSRLERKEATEMYDIFLDRLEEGQHFDVGCLENPSEERILLEMHAMLVSQLTKERGTFVVTDSRVYFQPLHNISGSQRVKSHSLSKIAAVVTRRSSLKDVGIELFFEKTSNRRKATAWGSSDAFIVFKTIQDRERVVTLLKEELGDQMGSRILEAEGEYLCKVTEAWQRGTLSNCEYLMYCNIVSGRSFNDLAQYPIFPWILKDFTSKVIDLGNPDCFRDLSKPIGALNPKRLQMFQDRYREMISMRNQDPTTAEEPFLYGTHYSCPGYTLFWLVRSMPAHMLRLQNGRFDAPDRSFTGILDAWESVYNSSTDLKELIPEFYCSGSTDFLRNIRGLGLGCRQNGHPVGDVELPPWAQGDAELFLSIHRDAIESEYVSANLHHWIDLIFGVYQRGDKARLHNNVFRHITYEGMVDIDAITDPVEKSSIEASIAEFGQCPRQIFMQPHPMRLVCRNRCDTRFVGNLDWSMLLKLQDVIKSLDETFEPSIEEKKILDQMDTGEQDSQGRVDECPKLVSEDAQVDLSGPCVGEKSSCEVPHSPSKWNSFAMSTLKTSMGNLKESVISSSRKASSMLKSSDIPQQLAEKMQSQWQAFSPRKNPTKYCTITRDVGFSSSITNIALKPKNESDVALALGDGCVMTIDGKSGDITGRVTLSRFPISSITWIGDHAIAAGHDGSLYKWNPEVGGFESSKAHSDIVSCIECIDSNFVASASWDHSIKVFDTEKGMKWHQGCLNPVHTFQNLSGAIWSMAVVSEHVILAGSEEGSVTLFDTRTRDACASCTICNDYIGGVCSFQSNPFLGVAAADGIVRIIDPRKGPDVIMTRDVGSPLLCCCAGETNIVYVGSEQGDILPCSIEQSLRNAPRSMVENLMSENAAVNAVTVSEDKSCIGIGREGGSFTYGYHQRTSAQIS